MTYFWDYYRLHSIVPVVILRIKLYLLFIFWNDVFIPCFVVVIVKVFFFVFFSILIRDSVTSSFFAWYLRKITRVARVQQKLLKRIPTPARPRPPINTKFSCKFDNGDDLWIVVVLMIVWCRLNHHGILTIMTYIAALIVIGLCLYEVRYRRPLLCCFTRWRLIVTFFDHNFWSTGSFSMVV
jgi:hypothetical protein